MIDLLLYLLFQAAPEALPQLPNIPSSWLTLIYWILAALGASASTAVVALWAAGHKICNFLAKEVILPLVTEHKQFSTDVKRCLTGIEETNRNLVKSSAACEGGIVEVKSDVKDLKQGHFCKFTEPHRTRGS